jgi:hypothetical protein
MLIIRWIAEQGVWFAPPVGVVLFAITPRQRRSVGSEVAVIALMAAFVLNLSGVWPRPARVSCSWDAGFPPACIERRSGTVTLPGPATEPAQLGGSVRVEVEPRVGVLPSRMGSVGAARIPPGAGAHRAHRGDLA